MMVAISPADLARVAPHCGRTILILPLEMIAAIATSPRSGEFCRRC